LKVLILSTYPVKKPFHGGQFRLANLIEVYKKVKFEIIQISIYDPNVYHVNETDKNDIPFPTVSSYRDLKKISTQFVIDYLSGIYASQNKSILNKIFNLVGQNIDLIHIEQPWLIDLALIIKKKFNNCKIIFGSQNIECELKGEIFQQYNLEKYNDCKKKYEEIKKLEIKAINESDLTLVVTENDQNWMEKNAAPRKFLLVPNGVNKIDSQPYEIETLSERIGSEKYALFVASAHPPNIKGFNTYIGDTLGCIPPDAKLVTAGSVSEHINNNLQNSRHRFINDARFVFWGRIEQNTLNNLISGAHAIILPIHVDTGSNLKTAEAILSEKYIIASSNSFRGYESYRNLSGIFFADNQTDFRRALSKVFELPPLHRSNEEIELSKHVMWEFVTQKFSNYLLQKS